MRVAILFLVLLWGTIGGARADEAADYLKAAGDEADALVKCLQDHAAPEMKSSKPADALADEAMMACDDKLGAIRIALMGPPTNLSADKAATETKVIKDGYRAQMIEAINSSRKE